MATILITGANRGIGLELTKRYLDRGDRVLACCRDPKSAPGLDALASNDNLSVHEVRVADGDSVAKLASSLKGQTIDVLLNNAGTPGPAPGDQSLMSMDFDGWAEAMAVNTMAPLRVLQALHENLKASDQAKAITITSQMGALDLNWPVMYAYCSSKAAVNKVMRMASVELAKEEIAVGLIHPGHVKTDMGGPNAEIDTAESATGIMSVIDDLTLESTGTFAKWNGEPHAW